MRKIIFFLIFYFLILFPIETIYCQKKLQHTYLNDLQSYSDTTILNEIFENKKIIAIGEATHNSREEIMFRFYLIKKLVETYKYNTILLEAFPNSVYSLNSYVNGEETSSLKKLLFENYHLYWIWKTEEFIEILEWIRNYNLNSKHKIQILGIDITQQDNLRDSLMAQNIINILNGNINTKAILLAHNAHISNKRIFDSNSMGNYLVSYFKEKYYTIGQIFRWGSFNVCLQDKYFALDTSYATYDIGNFFNKLKNKFPSSPFIINTHNNKLLNKHHKIWFYGATLNFRGQEKYIDTKLSDLFDAIVYHDSIYSASNISKNGNYYIHTTHIIKTDTIIKQGEMVINIEYETTSSTLVDIQLNNNFRIIEYRLDTLRQNINTYNMKLVAKDNFNTIIVKLYLMDDGDLLLKQGEIRYSSDNSSNNLTKINDNIFQLNYDFTSINKSRNINSTLKYENGIFKISRRSN